MLVTPLFRKVKNAHLWSSETQHTQVRDKKQIQQQPSATQLLSSEYSIHQKKIAFILECFSDLTVTF